MNDNFDTDSLRAVVFTRNEFDSFSFRRGIKKDGRSCSVTVASPDDLLIYIEDEKQAFEVAIVDYSDFKAFDLDTLAAILLQNIRIPFVGLFKPSERENVAKALTMGFDSYLVLESPADVGNLLPAIVSRITETYRENLYFKAIHEAYERSEREKRAVLNASLTLVTCHEKDTKISWSNAFEPNENGETIDHLAGRYCYEIWQNGGQAALGCPVSDAIATGKVKDAEVVTLDDYKMLQRAFPLIDDSGEVLGAVACTLDTSVLTPAEEAIRTAARIQASATLAGGIAHKFNNLMAGVLGNVSLITEDIGHAHSSVPLLGEIEEAAKNAGALSEQLLAFARGGRYLPKVLCLADLIKEYLHVEQKRFPPDIEFVCRLEPGLWSIEASPSQMRLMISQIVSNAIEAIEGNGKIIITARNEAVKSGSVKGKPGIEAGDYIVLTIQDDGKGMDTETKTKIFEPFYTTKSRGRGLGLSGVYGIIRSHRGHISVESEQGSGTLFTVFFPSSNLEPMQLETNHKQAQMSLNEPVPTGYETILVVDDEDMLRNAMERSLKRLGYNVLVAKTGNQAVEIAKEYDGNIQLTLLDLIMPGLDGMESYRMLHDVRPEMKMIIVTGHDKETYENVMLKAGASAFLQKPLTIESLARHIRKALDEG